MPRRAFSARPRNTAITSTHTRPASTAGSTGMKKATASVCWPSGVRAVAARMVGPPQGRMFMVPADRATMVARVVRFMPKASYKGSRAGTQIRKVTAPEPSRWTMAARMAVPMAILIGSVPTRSSTFLMMGRKVPASVRMPKNRMEKMNMTPVAATEPMPLEPVIILPMLLKFATKSITPGAFSGSVTKNPQAMMPVTTGTAMRATRGDAFLVMMRTSISTTVRKPKNANIEFSSSFFSFSLWADMYRGVIRPGNGTSCAAATLRR